MPLKVEPRGNEESKSAVAKAKNPPDIPTYSLIRQDITSLSLLQWVPTQWLKRIRLTSMAQLVIVASSARSK